MTKQQEEFECYCLDRLKPIGDDFPIAYNDGSVIKKLYYKIGLIANIKHQECFILYTASDQDLEGFTFITKDAFYDNQKRFYTEILTITELKSMIKTLPAINIFEFTSLLQFSTIYAEFKEILENNWDILEMDSLIEI